MLETKFLSLKVHFFMVDPRSDIAGVY